MRSGTFLDEGLLWIAPKSSLLAGIGDERRFTASGRGCCLPLWGVCAEEEVGSEGLAQSLALVCRTHTHKHTRPQGGDQHTVQVREESPRW